jgi:DeoR/GlpR family transcriptional regulator of sugar metabolism
MPMGVYELCKALGVSYLTVERQLAYLEKLRKVEKIELRIYDPETKQNKTLWQIKKKQKGG